MVESPDSRTPGSHRGNLPVQRSRLIGRERELAGVRQRLLREDVGLLTLTGPGGVGKTRLGLQVAAEARDRFPDGVFLVELASVADPDLAVTVVARAVGVSETAGRPILESLTNGLHSRRVLLLLDNFEHLLAAGRTLAELLAACPDLKLLVTSRAILRVSCEHEFPVPPLGLPGQGDRPSFDSLADSDAVRLFVERAQAARPDFALTNTNARTVAEICRRLDGLPLAIELAAARIRLLPTDALLARLERRLVLLTDGPRDRPTRQWTLRDTIAWSTDLLDDAGATLIRRLAVFAGGWTIEAAEAVCDGGSTLDLLSTLVDQSLIQQGDSLGEPRFAMLETIRELALEQLVESGEADDLRRRHADYYLRFAEAADRELNGPRQATWFERLDLEHGNLRAVLDWASSNDPQVGLRLAVALGRFWGRRGHFAEGRARLAALLALPETQASSSVRASALYHHGLLARDQGDYPMARARFEESLAVARLVDDRLAIAYALIGLGTALRRQNDEDHATSRAVLEESVAMMEGLDAPWGLALALNALGITLNGLGDFAGARGQHERSLAIRRELGDAWGTAMSLNNLGVIAEEQGDLEAARAFHEEGLAINRAIGVPWSVAHSLRNLGFVAYGQGDFANAAALFEESLTIGRRLGNWVFVAECLLGLAGVAGARRAPHRAARLFGFEEALRESLDQPLYANLHAWYDRAVADARRQLDRERFAAAWAEGRATRSTGPPSGSTWSVTARPAACSTPR